MFLLAFVLLLLLMISLEIIRLQMILLILLIIVFQDVVDRHLVLIRGLILDLEKFLSVVILVLLIV